MGAFVVGEFVVGEVAVIGFEVTLVVVGSSERIRKGADEGTGTLVVGAFVVGKIVAEARAIGLEVAGAGAPVICGGLSFGAASPLQFLQSYRISVTISHLLLKHWWTVLDMETPQQSTAP